MRRRTRRDEGRGTRDDDDDDAAHVELLSRVGPPRDDVCDVPTTTSTAAVVHPNHGSGDAGFRFRSASTPLRRAPLQAHSNAMIDRRNHKSYSPSAAKELSEVGSDPSLTEKKEKKERKEEGKKTAAGFLSPHQ